MCYIAEDSCLFKGHIPLLNLITGLSQLLIHAAVE